MRVKKNRLVLDSCANKRDPSEERKSDNLHKGSISLGSLLKIALMQLNQELHCINFY